MKTNYLCIGTGVAALLVAPAFAGDYDENEIPWDVAEVFFELNNTDGDLGMHALVDGGPWKRLCTFTIWRPARPDCCLPLPVRSRLS